MEVNGQFNILVILYPVEGSPVVLTDILVEKSPCLSQESKIGCASLKPFTIPYEGETEESTSSWLCVVWKLSSTLYTVLLQIV